MKKSINFLLRNKIHLIIVLSFLSLTACEKENDINETNQVDINFEEEQVLEVWNKINEYGSRGDWENYQYYFDKTDKLQVIHPGLREWLNGWDEFSAVYSNRINPDDTWTTISSDVTINICEHGKMAWAVTDFIFSMDSQPGSRYHTWGTSAFEKVDGEWKIVMAMSKGI